MAREPYPTRPFPVGPLKEALGLGDGATGIWTALGVVEARDDSADYWAIADGDLRLDVRLARGGRAWARLSAIAAGSALGIWRIPPAGTEVLVAFPDGVIDGEAVVVAQLATGQLPDGLDGPGKVIVAVAAGEQVLIHDGNAGDAKPLATKDDVDNHTHALPALQISISGTPYPVQATPIPSPPTPAPASPGDVAKPTPVDGTSVLLAK